MSFNGLPIEMQTLMFGMAAGAGTPRTLEIIFRMSGPVYIPPWRDRLIPRVVAVEDPWATVGFTWRCIGGENSG